MAKKAMHWAWRIAMPCFFTVMFFFFAVEPARAPRGGKNSLNGRTLASLQEEEFDHRLLNLQLCYGIRFNGDGATPGRRRVCKALVVHSLDNALAAPGTITKFPLEFRCEDTVFSKDIPGSETAGLTVLLKPNDEFKAIDDALEKAIDTIPATEEQALNARETCEFLTDCKWAMRPHNLSFRKLGACLTAPDMAQRKIFLDELSAMLFHVKARQSRVLASELLQNPAN
jgi:hypothetical protein